MLTCSLMQLCVYGQTDLINNNVIKIALSDIAELIQFIPKFNTEYKGVLREIRLDKFNYMGRLLFLAGGYSCSWMVTNDPGVTLPPHRGRVSGTQGQRWWVLLLLGTAGPPTPVPYWSSRSSVEFQGHMAIKIIDFDPDWVFPDCHSSLNWPMALKWFTKLEVP